MKFQDVKETYRISSAMPSTTRTENSNAKDQFQRTPKAGSSVAALGLAYRDPEDPRHRPHRYLLATISSYHVHHRQIVYDHHVPLSPLDELVRTFGSVPVFELVALDI